MIWLNKLIRDVDNFYSKAISAHNLPKSAAETFGLTPAQLQRLQELQKQKAADKAKLEQEQKALEEKQKILESGGREALRLLDAWDPTDNLRAPYKNFMEAYVQLFTRINEIKPDLVGDALDVAKEQLGLLLDEDEEQQEIFNLDNAEEYIEEITELATQVLPARFAEICKFPYLVQKKTVEDAEKELEELKMKESLSDEERKKLEQAEKLSSETPMWDEDFTSTEFITAIHSLLMDAQTSAQAAVGIQLEHAQEAVTALEKSGPPVPESMDQAFQPGQRITGNIAQQKREAIARFKAKCWAAWRQFQKSKGSDTSHDHFTNALKIIEQRARYEDKLRSDPSRLAHRQKGQKKRYDKFINRIQEHKDLIEEYHEATTPGLKKLVIRRMVGFLQNNIWTRGLTDDQTKALEAMINEGNALDKIQEPVAKFEESKRKKRENELAKRQKAIALGAYSGLLKKFSIALSDRKAKFTKAVKEKGIDLELSYFDVPRTALRNLEAALLKAENEGFTQAELKKIQKAIDKAKVVLGKAMAEWAEQDPSVQAVLAELEPLFEFEKQVRQLLVDGLISDEPLNLDQQQVAELDRVTKLLKHLVLQYESKRGATAAVKHARKLIEKIENSSEGGTYTEEPVTKPQPEEPAVTPDLTEILKGSSMSIKTRKNILQRLQKEAMEKMVLEAQDTSINDLLARIGDTSQYQSTADSMAHRTFLDLADKVWGTDDASMSDDESYVDDEDDDAKI